MALTPLPEESGWQLTLFHLPICFRGRPLSLAMENSEDCLREVGRASCLILRVIFSCFDLDGSGVFPWL